jgi:hypothetical protein
MWWEIRTRAQYPAQHPLDAKRPRGFVDEIKLGTQK